ncbi:mannose-1-phosphate guanylyltransferase/mannose-6-phosphate isomerase [Shewanella sp. UCD-KL12]|uniref:mannose-1-phosphate guanylyltransferase/mannose-6-phosphate isomerase n=1 Tax=Shewanella sp. UCD-KL12 TaxID=1917163 RepID=UPI0009706ACD|nr:mannose-1-phosphate guanylyltransferase/mannose-6-phosphate isomerase [Shewanella sp. UCD-KL12]
MILPVVMAGGSGTRLWPLSRQRFPKQFLTLDGEDSMLQATLLRLSGLDNQAPLIICNEEHRFSVAEQLRAAQLKHSGIILEPVGRNTAPAIAIAALQALKSGQDPVLLVLAADHVIKDEAAFCQTLASATALAEANKLVTFGVVPTKAETGYGYIKRGSAFSAANQDASALDKTPFTIDRFVEKPDLETAKHYLKSGDYYWNSGIFMFKASVYLTELKNHQPEIYSACELAIANTQSDLDFIRIDRNAFEACHADSIDYAVMEPLCNDKSTSSKAIVVPLDCSWSDVGSWHSLWEVSNKDPQGNAIRGDVIANNTRNSYIHAQDKLVTTIGLEDMVVVETKDAVLIAKQSDVQQVKAIVEQLDQEQRPELMQHKQVYRPWGKYDAIDAGERFLVKRISVNPGEKLSLQMHHHRAEHWIVVSGTAKITKGDEELLLSENQSTYIPIGMVHSLENPGKLPLELIEVQSGSYLGEDDIIRFQDKYGRN